MKLPLLISLTALVFLFPKEPVVNKTTVTIEGKVYAPIRTYKSTSSKAVTLTLATETLDSKNNACQLTLDVPAPKVGRYSFNNGDADALLIYSKDGVFISCYSRYYRNGKSEYSHGHINVVAVDLKKRTISGNFSGSLMQITPVKNGQKLIPIKVSGSFQGPI